MIGIATEFQVSQQRQSNWHLEFVVAGLDRVNHVIARVAKDHGIDAGFWNSDVQKTTFKPSKVRVGSGAAEMAETGHYI